MEGFTLYFPPDPPRAARAEWLYPTAKTCAEGVEQGLAVGILQQIGACPGRPTAEWGAGRLRAALWSGCLAFSAQFSLRTCYNLHD